MRYDIHLLEGSTAFEGLVISICHDILGIGAHTFSTGKDGGRDSKFEGTATKYPSTTSPWQGKFIVQAKFTESAVASCSDSAFKNQLKNEELPRIKKLIEINDLDAYIIFTNRKLTAGTHHSLQEWLRGELNVDNVDIHGVEDLCAWLSANKDIVDQFKIDRGAKQIRFYEKDIKDLIITFNKDKTELAKTVENNFDFSDKFLDKQEKNVKNNLSAVYFEHIKSNSLAYFDEINKFLNDPKNSALLELYKQTVVELQHKITISREDFDKFEDILDVLYQYILDKNQSELSSRRALIQVFLHFMYFNCDIGIK